MKVSIKLISDIQDKQNTLLHKHLGLADDLLPYLSIKQNARLTKRLDEYWNIEKYNDKSWDLECEIKDLIDYYAKKIPNRVLAKTISDISWKCHIYSDTCMVLMDELKLENNND
jgi:hypothetical protein